jgi:hypothetical protein
LKIVNFLKNLFIYLLVQNGPLFRCSGFISTVLWETRNNFLLRESYTLAASPLGKVFSQKLVKNAGTAGTQEREV